MSVQIYNLKARDCAKAYAHGDHMMPFRRLWARMLSMFTAQLPLILRLVAIAMTLTTDTSGCERLTSLMNDFKLQTEFQTRMEHDLPALADVPVVVH
jgi:hypothetical protein